MIGSVAGEIIQLDQGKAIIETVSGVGYRVTVGNQALSIGQTVRLYTYHQVREDASDLYGFLDNDNLALFELLLTVSGVGPKLAQSILNVMARQTIIDAIASNQPAIFKSIPGVGQRVAEKIIVELKNKVSALGSGSLAGQQQGDLFEALVGFGYRQQEIAEAMKSLDPSQSVEVQLKSALKLLAK